MPWQNVDLDFALGALGKQCSAFTPLPMKTDILWKTKMSLEGGFANIATIFQARNEGERDHLYETILSYVQKVPDDIRGDIDRNESELMASKKESALGPDGIPGSFYRCAGGLGSQFLFNAYKHFGR